MDRDRLLGESKIWNPDGSLRWGKILLDGLGHYGIGVGGAILVVPWLAYFAGLGIFSCIWIGALAGFVAVLAREAIQWGTSGSPHLEDRVLDLIPSPFGGASGGLLCFLLVSRFLL